MDIEDWREQLDYEEACNEQDKAEMQGAFLAVGILISIVCLGLFFGG